MYTSLKLDILTIINYNIHLYTAITIVTIAIRYESSPLFTMPTEIIILMDRFAFLTGCADQLL